MVFLPDYYRGGAGNTADDVPKFLKEESNWNGRLKSDVSKVMNYSKEFGCKSYGAIGTCWGTYPVIRMSESVDIKAGISMHPSHPNIMGMYQIDRHDPPLIIPIRKLRPFIEFSRKPSNFWSYL